MKHRCLTAALAGIACTALISTAPALDLNAFRAQHGRGPLAVSSTLAAAAYEHAQRLARRQRLDHVGFRQRLGPIASTAAENVAFGCETQDCAIRMWARSGGHRANMLMGGVTRYGIASATGANGRRYWVLIVGN